MTRNLKGNGLDEGASTRLLVHAGKLIARGIAPRMACNGAIAEPLTDDPGLFRRWIPMTARHCFDAVARGYLPHLYGPVNWTLVDEVARLPLKVADVYRRLTGWASLPGRGNNLRQRVSNEYVLRRPRSRGVPGLADWQMLLDFYGCTPTFAGGTMTKRDEYVGKLKAQLDQWNAQVIQWEEKAREAQAHVRTDYEKQLEAFRRQRDEALEQMRRVQSATGDAWVDLVRGADEAWSRMREAFEKARTHFHKEPPSGT
jgi:hypothetical protein